MSKSAALPQVPPSRSSLPLSPHRRAKQVLLQNVGCWLSCFCVNYCHERFKTYDNFRLNNATANDQSKLGSPTSLLARHVVPVNAKISLVSCFSSLSAKSHWGNLDQLCKYSYSRMNQLQRGSDLTCYLYWHWNVVQHDASFSARLLFERASLTPAFAIALAISSTSTALNSLVSQVCTLHHSLSLVDLAK